MKQFELKKSVNEFGDESKKYTEMKDKLNELYEKLQGDVSEEEGDAIIEEFQNLVKNCGAAFELRVIPGSDSPVVTGESKAGSLIFEITTEWKKKGYREPINASLEEILERNAQINEIKERFDKLKEDIAKSSDPDDLAKIESEFKEYLKSLGSAYEVAISPMLDIEAHANPSICAVGSLFDLSSDQTIDCFESAVDAFQDRLQQKIRSYCDINNANKRGKCYVH